MTSDNTGIIGCFQLNSENPMCEQPAHQVNVSRIGVLCEPDSCKGPVMGENSSLTFTCYVKTVPVYDFKPVWVVPHPSVKELFQNDQKREQNDDILFIESF